ncbi:hypothetical protein BDZ97DRAFT_1752804 [Flammula alnicola]|nr:hypothetical protein BDZ97DRAFT_1752804 [Flammula alnicola]
MSDLKARIGPKVGRELFPNKTWVRPGLDINTITPRPKWKNNKQVTTGYDSDQSSHEDMSATDRKPGFCRTSQSGTASLLTRMGLSPGGSEGDALEELEAQDVVKSLIERVQGTAANERGDLGAGHSNFHNAGFVTRISAAQDMNVKSLNNGEVNDNHQSPILETNLNAELAKTPSDNQLVGTTNNKEDKENLSNRRSHHLSSQNNGNDNVVDGPQGAKNLATGPSAGGGPDKNHFVPNFLDATHAHPVINPNSSSHPGLGEQTGMPRKHISHISTSASSGGSSGPEEGELSEPLPADKVRDLVLPLVLRNAADRTKDTEKETSSQPTPVDSNVLSDEVLSSFARRTRTIEGELHSHNVEPSTNISGSQAIASRAAGVAGAATASSSPTGGSSTAQISIRSDRPTPAPPITFAPQAAADIHTVHRYDIPLAQDQNLAERAMQTIVARPTKRVHRASQILDLKGVDRLRPRIMSVVEAPSPVKTHIDVHTVAGTAVLNDLAVLLHILRACRILHLRPGRQSSQSQCPVPVHRLRVIGLPANRDRRIEVVIHTLTRLPNALVGHRCMSGTTTRIGFTSLTEKVATAGKDGGILGPTTDIHGDPHLLFHESRINHICPTNAALAPRLDGADQLQIHTTEIVLREGDRPYMTGGLDSRKEWMSATIMDQDLYQVQIDLQMMLTVIHTTHTKNQNHNVHLQATLLSIFWVKKPMKENPAFYLVTMYLAFGSQASAWIHWPP